MKPFRNFLCLMFAIVLLPTGARAGDLLVFAASSLKNAMEDVATGWQAQSGQRAVISLAGSSTLARQIQAGAPADLYLSANERWVDILERDGLLRAGSRRDLLTNRLVLVAHDPDATPIAFDRPDALAERLGDEHLAMALVDAVPAGLYGKAALQSLDWWSDVSPNVAQADNVRAALALVATGEAPFGIVYATDAAAEPRVTAIGTFPADTHPPIRYPMAIPIDSTSPDAASFAAYLVSPAASAVFEAHGFGLVEQAGE